MQAALGDAYHVERELGGGGMSRLFLATEASLHRQVVIKLLPPELASEVSAARFKQEIQLTAHLQHPNILQVLAAGATVDLLFYVMPFVSGESLRHRLTREGKLPVADAARILHEIADALAYAHAEGVIHRDIKPENILLLGGHAVLTDFGVARALVQSHGRDRLTDTGLALGTPGYMSPEQAAGEPNIDARADVYTLAVVGYEMLTGRPPFAGPTAQAVIAAHLTATPQSVTDLRPEAPPHIANAIARALAKDPNVRLRTAAEFRDALGAGVLPDAHRWSRSRWLAAGAALSVTVAAVVLAIALSRRGRSSVISSASVIAVLPFAPSSADTALARLGRDLVVTISANLDGVGDIRAVDPLTVLAQVTTAKPLGSLDEGAALVRRLGAASVVHGSLVRVGPNVRLDVDLVTTDSLTSIARASVTTRPESVTALTDSATWALLHEVWRTKGAPTPTVAAVTTRSIAALRAFLEGERALAEFRWEGALQAFGQAVQADSTFWLAYWRYWFVQDWMGQRTDSAVIAAFQQHRFALPERERLMIEGGMVNGLGYQIAGYHGVTERFPDYWLGWLSYADHLMHGGSLLGYTYDDVRRAFQRTVELNPGLMPAWGHLWQATAWEGDTTAMGQILLRVEQQGGSAPDLARGVASWRLLQQYFRKPSALDKGLLDSVAHSYAGRVLGVGLPPQLAIVVDERAGPVPGSAPSPAGAWLPPEEEISYAWAARGAWDSAFVAMNRFAQHTVEDSAALERYRLSVAGVSLGALDPAVALVHRAALVNVSPRPPEWLRTEVEWLDGVLAAARRDRAGLATARDELRQSRDSAAPILNRSLAAFELELRGQRAQAAQALAQLEWDRAKSKPWDEPLDGNAYRHPFVTAIDRLAAGAWLLATGDTTQATQLLIWCDGWLVDREDYPNALVCALARFQRARIEDARGNVDFARRHYADFLQRYDMPLAAHRRLVDQARAALERLSTKR